nr:MFS transporter [uncultured Hyphomonas sp.]
MVAPKPPLTPSLQRIYGVAHFGKSLFWNTSSLIFAFFLTELAGFSPSVMGYVLASSLVFNAFVDLTAGRVLSAYVRTTHSAARAQLLASLFAGFAFITFTATGMVPDSWKVGYAIFSLLLFRLGYSFYDVPQNAFMSLASSTDAERAKLASIRYMAAGTSILFITLIFAPLVRNANADDGAIQFLGIGVFLTFIVILSALLLFLNTRKPRPAPPADKAESSKHAEAALIRTPKRPDIFPLLLGSIFCLSLTASAFTKLEAYFTAYFVKIELTALAFMACVALGKTVSQPLWSRLVEKFGLPSAFQVSILSTFLAAISFLLLAGWEPYGTLLVGVAYGACSGGIFMTLWSLLAKAASARPDHTTRRFGLFTFFSKNAQAASILGLGGALSTFDYTEGLQADKLVWIMSGAPALGTLALLAVSIIIRKST